MPELSVDGVRLWFEDRGSGLPVLLLHGFPLSGESFRAQVEALSSKYRFIVPDHRGFGKSGCGEGPTLMSRIAEDALAILDALKIPSAVVGGVSMGGYASMALLRQDPSRVRGLVLADTHPWEDDAPGKARREATAQAVLDRGMPVLVESMLPNLVSSKAKPQLRAELEALILRNPPQGAAAALRGMALRPDSRDILTRYAGPVLAVVGEADAITSVERVEKMAGLLSGARLVKLPGAGHLANQEAPEAFNAALDAFLRAL